MWDTVPASQNHLSHDMPCTRCGHAMHSYLSCRDDCACPPTQMPGTGGAGARVRVLPEVRPAR